MELEGSRSFGVFTAAQSHDVGQERESHVHRTFSLLGKAEKRGLLYWARFGWGGGGGHCSAPTDCTCSVSFYLLLLSWLYLFETMSQGLT